MRLVVLFDLPTTTLEDKKEYRRFRKFLIDEGFIMYQYSVYSKLFLNNTSKETMVERVRRSAPKKGFVSLLSITEKQFAKMILIAGQKDCSVANSDARIVILGDDDDDEA